MKRFVYEGVKTKEISFPLGGIGSGCIGLAGNGRLIDWEIYNRPNKGSTNGFTHFAVKAEKDGKVLDARVLHGDLQPPYSGTLSRPEYSGFGFGPGRETLSGVPHFRETIFTGEYPFAHIQFIDETFPGQVEMTAFNPFIPLNDQDSSIPGAFFELCLTNTTHTRLTYTLCFSAKNPHPAGSTVNTFEQQGNISRIHFSSTRYGKKDPEYGDLTLATDAPEVSWQEYWYRGRWFDNLGIFWREFTAPGCFSNRHYSEPGDGASDDIGSLAAHFELDPHEKKNIRFILTWNYPNCYNYWNTEKCGCAGESCCSTDKPKTWRNYYATLFENSVQSAVYGLHHWTRLYNETLQFKNALFSSTLPEAALDAISANISILKTPTAIRLEDGSFYGWEGCHANAGCCEGSCTHVWNYAYALPFLFPRLERSMRDLDFTYNQREDGSMSFRLQLPLGRERSSFRACADGQFGGVVKAYRDWKISGDTAWLRSRWHAIRKSIEFAWAESNEDRWDYDKDGVLEGRQHHTLDMELFGPNSWLTGFYLAALKAGAEMADHLGEADRAEEYLRLFHRGKTWVDQNLFNGEYYHQQVDLTDKHVLEEYDGRRALSGSDAVQAYWNDEKGELKYQIGEGCAIDQVLAQWHANLCSLGEIFDREQTRKALASIYKYNFKKSMRHFFNACRLYCLNDESGIVICDWPEGRYKPAVPVTYAEETMNGFEYQAAIHMIQEGMVREGMEIVEAIRARYDGEKRNPWNEFECGSNYARSMASYALLNAFSGFSYNMVEGTLGFHPVGQEAYFRCFWSLDSGWGTFTREEDTVRLDILYGRLLLKKLLLPFLNKMNSVQADLDGKPVACRKTEAGIDFDSEVLLPAGSRLTLYLK